MTLKIIKIKGINKRWVFNSLGFTIGVFTILVISFMFIMRGYFYNGIQQAIRSCSNEAYHIFHSYPQRTSAEFADVAKMYVENFPESNIMDVMLFDENGEALISSSGFLPKDEELIPNYEQAKSYDNDYDVQENRTLSGEKFMMGTRFLYDQSNTYMGAVRYLVSLEDANSRIITGSVVLILIAVLVIVFMIISGMYFIRSIVRPVTEICSTAKLIARGDFNIKIDKKYDDEIGELSDTINNMAEELSAAEKMKNEFISSVSHELRTPLTAIKGWAETMQMCASDPFTMKKGLDTIVSEAERLSWIVESLLDFSSIQDKRMNLLKEKLDVLAELGEAVYMFKERAASEHKSLVYNEPKMLPPIFGDKNRLKQVFINIIDNALKYTSEGGGVSVNVGVKEENICVSVTDNGCGIPQEHLPNITKKFYKANYVHPGSGIGLAIVDEIVTLHDGTFDVISEEGFGTTVTVCLPIMENQEIENTDEE